MLRGDLEPFLAFIMTLDLPHDVVSRPHNVAEALMTNTSDIFDSPGLGRWYSFGTIDKGMHKYIKEQLLNGVCHAGSHPDGLAQSKNKGN